MEDSGVFAKRIGIIGAGISGCSAAYFARKRFPFAEIDVFEKSEQIGGRVVSMEIDGVQIELGASFIHSSNAVLIGLMKELDLEKWTPSENRAETATVSIWNGQSLRVSMPGRGVVTRGTLLYRYGWAVVRTQSLVKRALANWLRIYRPPLISAAFFTPAELLSALGLLTAASQETRIMLAASGIEGPIVDELITGVMRAIFNQDARINGVAGLIALAGTGFGGGRTFSVAGGNRRLCEELLRASRARLHLNLAARTVSRRHTELEIRSDTDLAKVVDAVIIATPLDTADVVLMDEPVDMPVPAQPTQSTHVTCIAGELSPSFFDVVDSARLPDVVLTTARDEIPFTAIVRIGLTVNGEVLYKIQSREALGDYLMARLFRSYRMVKQMRWNAYPLLRPVVDCPRFKLADGIYYVSAMESIVSTLETQTVAARNVVDLIEAEANSRAL